MGRGPGCTGERPRDRLSGPAPPAPLLPVHHHLEATVNHALAIKGHALRLHELGHARILHDLVVDFVALGARRVDDPGQPKSSRCS
jgi:hypothetical protein